jgi:CBS-domain-containing membrane protein
MTRRVFSVRPDDSILHAGELMLQHDISGLPVVDADGRVVGIVTERDFMRCAAASSDVRPRWLEVLLGRTELGDGAAQRCESRIADVMTRNPVTVTEEMPIEDVVRLMDTHYIKRVPVVRDGRLVGIICRADLMRALVRSIRAGHSTAKSDEALRSHMAELERQTLLHRTRGSMMP